MFWQLFKTGIGQFPLLVGIITCVIGIAQLPAVAGFTRFDMLFVIDLSI